jgi:hypothetical protein
MYRQTASVATVDMNSRTICGAVLDTEWHMRPLQHSVIQYLWKEAQSIQIWYSEVSGDNGQKELERTRTSLKNQVSQTMINDPSALIHGSDPQVSYNIYTKAVPPLDNNSVDSDHDSSQRPEVSWQSKRGNHQRLKQMTETLYQDMSWSSRIDSQYPWDMQWGMSFLEYDKAIVFKPQHRIVNQLTRLQQYVRRRSPSV